MAKLDLLMPKLSDLDQRRWSDGEEWRAAYMQRALKVLVENVEGLTADARLTEDLALALLNHRDLPREALEALSKNGPLARLRKVRMAIAGPSGCHRFGCLKRDTSKPVEGRLATRGKAFSSGFERGSYKKKIQEREASIAWWEESLRSSWLLLGLK